MKLAEAWSPIQVGDERDIGIDFAPDAGGAYILDVLWTCRLTRFSEGFDPDPQSRVLSMSAQMSTFVRRQDGSVVPEFGVFAVARVGGMPASAAGATYIFDAKVYLSDGQQISHNSTMQCVLSGQ